MNIRVHVSLHLSYVTPKNAPKYLTWLDVSKIKVVAATF